MSKGIEDAFAPGDRHTPARRLRHSPYAQGKVMGKSSRRKPTDAPSRRKTSLAIVRRRIKKNIGLFGNQKGEQPCTPYAEPVMIPSRLVAESGNLPFRFVPR
jgi:hypothetical protein